MGRQHSWYHGSKPDIFRFSFLLFFFIFFCPANDRLRPLYGSVVFSISVCAGFGWIGGALGGLEAGGKLAVAGTALVGVGRVNG